MHPNAELIDGFYRAFAARDHASMARCYDADVSFSDPVFVNLRGDEVRAMWRMLCVRGTDLAVTFGEVSADDEHGSVRWEATYTFSPTGRRVHNRIAASFELADGRIVRHRDDFDLYRWTRMALGPVGWALGWTPFLRAQVRSKAGRQLKRFQAEEASGSHP